MQQHRPSGRPLRSIAKAKALNFRPQQLAILGLTAALLLAIALTQTAAAQNGVPVTEMDELQRSYRTDQGLYADPKEASYGVQQGSTPSTYPVDPNALPQGVITENGEPATTSTSTALPPGTCGPKFERITDQIAHQTLLRRISGTWTEETRSYVRQADNTYDSIGFAFLPDQSRFGPIIFKYTNFDLGPSLQSISHPHFDSITFAKDRLSGELAGYRMAELRTSTAPQHCETFAFMAWQGQLHVVRGLQEVEGQIVAAARTTLSKDSDTFLHLIPYKGRLPGPISRSPQQAETTRDSGRF